MGGEIIMMDDERDMRTCCNGCGMFISPNGNGHSKNCKTIAYRNNMQELHDVITELQQLSCKQYDLTRNTFNLIHVINGDGIRNPEFIKE